MNDPKVEKKKTESNKKEEIKDENRETLETAAEDIRVGDASKEIIPEPVPNISADEARELLKAITNKTVELQKYLEEKEKARIEETLSGKSEAGETPPKIDPEEENTKEINDWLKGTGMSI